MGKKKAPSQPTTKSDLGLFGSTTTGKTGSEFTPTDFQNQYVGLTQNAILNAQKAINDREIAAEAVDNLNNKFQLDFQNQLLTPAMNKGWLRGSSANDLASIANQDYQTRRYDLINEEQTRQQQALANALAGYSTMYDISKGVTGLSNALNQANSNYALQKAQMDNANRIGWGDALAATATVAGAAASDIRLKENIRKLDTVDGINIYKFDFIDGAKDQVGVIAQEMQEKCPECVIDGEYLSVDYSKLPQAVQARIEELK